MVKTEYFAYIAADDWMEPHRSQWQVELLDSAGPLAALAYSDVYRADEQGNRLPELLSEGMGEVWQPENHAPYVALLAGNWIPAPSIMIRTEALRSVGGYDATLFYEDHDVVLRLARSFEFVYCPQPVATHRELTSSLGHQMFFVPKNRMKWLVARVQLYRKHLGHSAEVDALIAPMLRTWIPQVYLAGAVSAPQAAQAMRQLAPHVPGGPDLRFKVLQAAASWGVPGRWLALNRGTPS